MNTPVGPTIVLDEQPRRSGKAPSAVEFAVSGMTCGNCARHVTEAIQGVAGVQSATVNLDAQRATVRWAGADEPNVAAVIQAVKAEGFGARVIERAAPDSGEHKLAGWQLNLWLGLPVTAVLMLGEWAFGWGTARWFQWLGFGLATVVQVFAGARFYRGAWRQLRAGNSNMDTLVALGSTTAFGYSTWALFSGQGGHLYFMEAAAIITLISLGHWVESRVSVRASSALRKLLNLAPALACRRNADGSEAPVPVSELMLEDLVVLRPGDAIPTDGVVEEGESVVNESMLTGESVPADKRKDSLLFAGTVNVNGRLVMRVTATGEQTALAHIVAAVQRAQSSRANLQRLGDRVSSVFVPLVVAVALGAALWWGLAPASARSTHEWLAHYLWLAPPTEGPLAAPFIIAAAVLIIACPCAMGLATPAAIMAGSNAAAQRGILIRDGIALEKAGQVTAVIFDKTGTLTLGRPEVAAVWPGGPGDQPRASSIQHLAALLARNSTHPVSQAVARFSPGDSNGSEVTDWREIHGAGVEGRLRTLVAQGGGANGQSGLARLGSLRWLRDAKVELAAGQGFIEEWSAQGATIVGFAVEESLRGLFAVKDTLKPGARAVVEQLQRQGLRTYLLTGDQALTAASLAKQVGIGAENVFAEVRPEQKADFVKRLQQQGARVAFVGDGINDAPALEQADLGIAVSRASDIAREAADIILLKSEIEAVPESLGLARATLRTIKQNLFWAFFYNGVGIPLAALGFMSPILCAAAMGLSDLVVIGNALRLRRWRL
jgi:P-type Cu+ transporter